MKPLELLRKEMKEKGVDIYIVPTSDFHQSEYVSEYFKCRAFLTGFTGSAGTAVVTMEKAGLWTDGRYFIQAERQLKNTGFTLYKMGMEKVPTILEFIKNELPENGVIGFDGRVMDSLTGEKLSKLAESKKGKLFTSEDLVGKFFKKRPELSHEKAWILDEKYAGESVDSKLRRIRKEMKKVGAKFHLIGALDDVCWTLNIRGNDAEHFPVVLSYLFITEKRTILFIQKEAVTPKIKKYFETHHIELAMYEAVYDLGEQISIKKEERFLLDRESINYQLYLKVSEKAEILDQHNPAFFMKARKNKTEIKNIRNAHIKDGVAMVKFIYWLKNVKKDKNFTEITASEQLLKFRRKQKGFLDISFDTIAAYKENGAIVHYQATEKEKAVIKNEGFLLVDSGGHYLEGSTDITRTIVLGELTEEEKELYTLVLRSHLRLQKARFLHGCTGQSLDVLARGPFWDKRLDFRHGTGHGIGYLLNIHEGPNGFRYRRVPERYDSGLLLPGMVTSDEPGIYIESKVGIRTENELLIVKDEKNEYGQFYSFEPLTYCPYDLSAVILSEMSKDEIEELNRYHGKVYKTLSPYLSKAEREFLKRETREV